MLRWGLRALAGLAALYLLLLGGAFLLQRRFIYIPERLAWPFEPSAASAKELVSFPSADGTRLTGLFLRPEEAGAPVVFVAHGNAGNVLTWRPFLAPFTRRGLGAFLLDPRGYGASEGSPDEEGWHQDAEAAVAWLASQGVPASRLILVGVSIGSGLAVPLAADLPVRALILQAAFTSLDAVASDHIPLVPWRLILRDRYDNLAAAARVRCPVLLLHGGADRTVSVEHARRLAAALPSPPLLRIAPASGHNDVGAWTGYEAALDELLAAVR